MKQQAAKDWGDFQRYHYLQFDFTEITEEGLYQVMYGDAASPVFRIAKDVWDKGIWQAEVEYFLPVQMCHMRVNEKYRVWHDFCHQDDARMAQTNINHIDGYSQGPSTLCKYQPGDLVPGLNVGGWHDAGDYDLRVESQAGEAYILAMACENFGASIRVVALLKQKKVSRIFARAIDAVHKAVLEAFSLEKILTPEEDAARSLVQLLDFGATMEAFRIDQDYYVVKFTVPKKFVGYFVNELNMDEEFHLKVIALKRANSVTNCLGISLTELHVKNELPGDEKVEEGDELVCYGKYRDFQSFWKAI